MSEKPIKTIIAVDVGECATLGQIAMTVATAVNAARSDIGQKVGAEVKLYSPYSWIKSMPRHDMFMRALAVRLALPLHLQDTSAPRDVIVRTNQSTPNYEVAGILQVQPGVCVTKDAVTFANNIKSYAFQTGFEVVSLLGGPVTPSCDVTVFEVDSPTHRKPYSLANVSGVCDQGRPAKAAERAFVISPNVVKLDDHEIDFIDDRLFCLFFNNKYLRSKLSIRAGQVGVTDSVAVFDADPCFQQREWPTPLPEPEEFPVEKMLEEKKSWGVYSSAFRDFVFDWLMFDEDPPAPGGVVRQILDVFRTFTWA